jgi:hypothetical protein
MLKLRWRFNYKGNRPSIVGDWNNVDQDERAGKRPSWAQPKANLHSAVVEALLPDGSVLTVAETPGDKFRNFEWIAEVQIRSGKVEPSIVGLSLVTENEVAEIFANGRTKLSARARDDQSYEGLKR